MGLIDKCVKIPRKHKKEVKKWFSRSFPNHPFMGIIKLKYMKIDSYMFMIYNDCIAEEKHLRNKDK